MFVSFISLLPLDGYKLDPQDRLSVWRFVLVLVVVLVLERGAAEGLYFLSLS